MAIAPINYTSQVVNPLDRLMQGIGQVQQVQMNEQAMAFKAAQYDPEAMQNMSADLGAVLGNPEATGEDIAGLLAKYPALQDEILKPWNAVTEERKASGLRFMGQMYSMLDSGNIDLALETVDQRIAAAERSGNKRAGQEAKMIKNLIQTDPVKAKNLAQMMGSVTGGADWAAMTGGGAKVGSQEILPDGTIIQSTPQGPIIWSSDGRRLTGDEAAAAVKRAREYGFDIAAGTSRGRETGKLEGQAELGATVAGAREAGEQGMKLANEAFTAASKARSTVSNIDDAIDAIDDGATSGWLESRFPSWKTSTIELENAANRLGLDIIGSVTFGALSEGELNLAMRTALPLTLKGDALKAWLIDKRDAQMKLIGYMEEQARFLSQPGNTLGMWLENVNGRASPQGEVSTPTSTRKPRSYLKALED